MDGPEIEPRTVMWAVAEITWEDSTGKPNRASATLEDTSRSGACLRLKNPVQVGSRVTIKWHREQFSAVARNCRRDGREFLLGVRRQLDASPPVAGQESKQSEAREIRPLRASPANGASGSALPFSQAGASETHGKNHALASKPDRSSPINRPRFAVRSEPVSSDVRFRDSTHLHSSFPSEVQASPERNAMPPKKLFSKFWRTPPNAAATKAVMPSEVHVNKPNSQPAESTTIPRTDLLSYEDIYHAAGILNPPSGYGIQKVVDMLNSERLHDLAKEVKRASVLMALDAAGTSLDDLLRDATRRQQALDSYDSSRRKQLEEFEAHKSRENAQIEAEMERLRAHYAERIQKNQEQVDQEKTALRSWQGAMQHESQRISEVLELCQKHTESPANSLSDLAGQGNPNTKPTNDLTAVKAAHA